MLVRVSSFVALLLFVYCCMHCVFDVLGAVVGIFVGFVVYVYV